MIEHFPTKTQEKIMLNVADLIESEFEPTSYCHDAACHIKALLCRVRELEKELESTEDNWKDLHEAIETAIKRIAARHKEQK